MSAIGTLHSSRKQYIWNSLRTFVLSWKIESVDIDGNICLGLTEFLSAWVKKQYKVWTIINQNKYSCTLSLMPKNLEFEFTKSTIWTKMAGQRFYNVFKSLNALIIPGQPNVYAFLTNTTLVLQSLLCSCTKTGSSFTIIKTQARSKQTRPSN